MTDWEIVKRDSDTLYIGNIRTVEFDLTLPVKGENGSSITWETGHDRIISVEGKVTRPKYGMGSRTVPLTATLTFGEASAKKVFEVKVLEEENKIKVAKVFPVSLKAKKGETYYLPTAVVIETEEGRTIPHEVAWDNHGETVYHEAGMTREHGYIAGTNVDVEACIEVIDGLEPEKKDPKPLLEAFDHGEALLTGDGHLKKAERWSEEFLLQVNDDQMLYNFRDAAGLDKKNAPEMVGWDAPDSKLKGHTTGHYLSGLALCYRATGNEKIKEKAEYMVASLKECQEAFAGKPGIREGFLSGYDETQFDQLEQYVRYPEIWAPYYTLHKILAGLLDCYEFAGIQDAFGIADRLGTWVYRRLSRLSRETLMHMWSLYIAGESGGMNDVMARLYTLTRNEDHLKAARFFDNDKLFFPMEEGIDALDTMHANQHIPQIIGCMKLFETTGEKKYYDIARFFWSAVTGEHTYVIGGTGEGEMFHGANEIGRKLSKDTAESCASYNMLKLTKDLFRYEPESFFMDYYERAMLNHIAASCEHAPTGGSTYFMPLAPGFTKEFEDENTCCHGTGLENHFKYTEAVYFKEQGSIYVNLFIPSVLTQDDISITQTVDQNDPGHICLKVTEQGGHQLKIRKPCWCGAGESIVVNKKPVDAAADCHGYYNIPVEGDTEIEISFPLSLHLSATPDVPELKALEYGPYVLAALTEAKDFLCLPLSDGNLEEKITKVSGEEVRFACEGIVFVPLYSICHEGYQVYFKTL